MSTPHPEPAYPILIRTAGGRHELLALALWTLWRSHLDNSHVVVDCDGPVDEATTRTLNRFDDPRLAVIHRRDEKLGVSGHLARATQTVLQDYATSWFYLLGDDVMVSPDWSQRLRAQLADFPDCGYVSGYNAPWADRPGVVRRAPILGLINATLWQDAVAHWRETTAAGGRVTLDGVFMQICNDRSRPPVSTRRSVIQHLGLCGESGLYNPPVGDFVGV